MKDRHSREWWRNYRKGQAYRKKRAKYMREYRLRKKGEKNGKEKGI